jgi:HEAT repeat protein
VDVRSPTDGEAIVEMENVHGDLALGAAALIIDPMDFQTPGMAGLMDDDQALDRAAAFYNTLDKVIRASKLYQGEGDLLERMIGDLEKRGLDLVQNGPVTVRVASFGLVYQGHPLAPDEKRVAYLFNLFCDGVRELTILDGIDREELEGLVEVLSSDRRTADDDLVTMLWKRQFRHVRYYAADTFAAGMEIGMDGDLVLSSNQRPGQFVSEGEGEEVTLSPDDIRLLAGEGHLEWIQEATAPLEATGKVAMVAERIRAAFRRPDDIQRFVALGLEQGGEGDDVHASALLLGLLDDILYQARSEQVAGVIQALLGAGEQHRAAAAAQLQALVEPQRLERLASAANRNGEPLAPLMKPLVERLGRSMVPLLKDLEQGEVQTALHTALAEEGHDLTSFYAKQLDDTDEATVLHAIESLGQVGTPEAVVALCGVLSRNSNALRRAALEAMIGKYHPEARIALARALKDPDRDNRLLALKVIQISGDNRMTWGLLSAVKELRFAEKDQEEQAAYYRALASFQDDRTVAHFQEILSRKNLTRSKGVVSAQLLAVNALAEVGTNKARETLKAFEKVFYHPAPVKEAIQRALRGSS